MARVHVLELYASEQCIGCAGAQRVLRAFAETRTDVTLLARNLVIAGERQRARAHGLLATPAQVVDGARLLYGIPQRDRLAQHLDGLDSDHGRS